MIVKPRPPVMLTEDYNAYM